MVPNDTVNNIRKQDVNLSDEDEMKEEIKIVMLMTNDGETYTKHGLPLGPSVSMEHSRHADRLIASLH